RQKLFLLRNIWSADLLVCEFAAYQSYLPALYGWLFGKPCLIVVGGTDAHYFPGIGYGNWQKRFLKTFTAESFKLCTHIAPKHKSLMFSEYHYDETEPKQQGIYARLPNLKTPYTEIPNGYDAVKWKCILPKKKNTFITVTGGLEYSFQQSLKGIDLILEVAPLFPECEFIILGAESPDILPKQLPNVKAIPPVKNDELIAIFSGCEYYMQLSMAEGFPNSICEAMLCECIPIGSEVFSIPEIIGDSGFVLKKRDVNLLRQLIGDALLADKAALMKKARARIADNYTLAQRTEKLSALCANLVKGKQL
ncbi:MAG TPA: glycosyltransferase family 4 protein, partial [Bacteroidia bacterium]|nr:glycosyltransferase family 4 protein [Bacteroidia bacterium]